MKIYSFLSILCFCSFIAWAQPPQTNQPSNIEANRENLMMVERNLSDLKAHEDYINSVGINNRDLPKQYDKWISQHPDIAVIPYAIGKAYEEHQDTRCVAYLKKAINVKPDFAGAWEHLSFSATLAGDDTSAINYMHHATESAPKNPDFAFYYASLFRNGDQAKFDSLMLNVAFRFPGDDRGCQAMNYLARISYNAAERANYYEMIEELFSKNNSPWFRTSMADYFDFLINSDPEKAFSLSLKMVLQEKDNRQEWKQRYKIAHKIMDGISLLNQSMPDSASMVFNSIDLNNRLMSRGVDGAEMLALLKANALSKLTSVNGVQAAYDSLVSFYAAQPSDNVYKQIAILGRQLKKDSTMVDKDVWKDINAKSGHPNDFTLHSYEDDKNISLSDFRGKVVLLTYWFPSCGPCNEEMAHFESVLKKLHNKNVAYLAINGFGTEDAYVLPFKKAKGYTFVPLRDEPNKPKANLPNVRMYPQSFIIDQTGRVVFSGFQINATNERMLELMITGLLKHDPGFADNIQKTK